MVDPTDLIALDELAFVSGCKIEPFVIPEVRFQEYLERYYLVQRPVRFLKLAKASAHEMEVERASIDASVSSGLLELDEDKALEETGSDATMELLTPDVLDQLPTAGDQVLHIKAALGVSPASRLTPADLNRVDDVPQEQRARLDACNILDLSPGA